MRAHLSLKGLKKTSYTDQDIIDAIINTSDEDQVLASLYKSVKTSLFPFIISNNGNEDDANDVLQDAIIVFYEKVKSQEFRLQTTITGYIYTIGKYIWLNKLKKQKGKTSIEDKEIESLGISQIDINWHTTTDTSEYVNEILHLMKESCKQILIDSIYKKMSMREIARVHGLKNEQIARNKKHKCLKTLRTVIEKSSYFSRILTELKI